MPDLHSLDISDNPIGDEGIRSLTPYFVQGLQMKFPLIDIKMESCSLSSKGVIELLEILSTMQEPLNTLSIADNDLGSHVAEPLAKFLGISRVRVLNIGDTGLGPSAFLELEEELPEMLALCDIDISGNRGGLETANFIAKILLRAPELVRINAASNFMPPESLVVLCAALKQSRGRLEQLDLTGNFSCCCATNLSEIMESILMANLL
ncbi:hypothetical protein QJS10_CPA09g01930 [Acorus calamus]|uniref:Uncharacterized protein n=1 Tax=Acorus calamus TaxID=4465 RepID=A0AAV9E3M4_ACOCL|nr:hypothetical protein QJS10_CPA09g01930 [Acorus calamus]